MITKEYVFECLLRGSPIEMEQMPTAESHDFRGEFALLRELGVIRRNDTEIGGATLMHPLKMRYCTADGEPKFVQLRRGYYLPPAPVKK